MLKIKVYSVIISLSYYSDSYMISFLLQLILLVHTTLIFAPFTCRSAGIQSNAELLKN